MGARSARKSVSGRCRAIVKSKIFRYSELFAVTANLLVLCLRHEGIPKQFLYSLCILFCIEFILEKEKVHEVLLWLICLVLVQYNALNGQNKPMTLATALFVIFNRITDAMEALFIIAFTVEMVLRFLAVGLTDFLDDRMKMNHPPVILMHT